MDDLLHRLMASDRQIAKNEAELARLVGRVEAAYDHLADDATHRDLLRARAWLRHDPSLRATYNGEAVSGVPDGWPESVPDPDEHVAEDIAERRQTRVERLLGPREDNPPPERVTPSVARLRLIVGGEQ